MLTYIIRNTSLENKVVTVLSAFRSAITVTVPSELHSKGSHLSSKSKTLM